MRVSKIFGLVLALLPSLLAPVQAERLQSVPSLIDLSRPVSGNSEETVNICAGAWFHRYVERASRDYEYAAPDKRWKAALSFGKSLLKGLIEDEQGFMCYDLVLNRSSRQVYLSDVAESAAAIQTSDFFSRSFQRRLDVLQGIILAND